MLEQKRHLGQLRAGGGGGGTVTGTQESEILSVVNTPCCWLLNSQSHWDNKGKCAPSAPAPSWLVKVRGWYLDSILKPGARAQVPAEGAGQHGRLPQLGLRVSQGLGEVAPGAWRDTDRGWGQSPRPPRPGLPGHSRMAPWEATGDPQPLRRDPT